MLATLSSTTPAASTAHSNAFAIAEKYLSSQREKVAAEIALLETAVAAAPTDAGDPNEDVFAIMDKRRWGNYTKPRLMKLADQWRVTKDFLPPDFEPSVNVQVDYGNSNHLVTFGQFVAPHKASGLHSPRVIITRDPFVKTTDHFTLIMTDLDRPDLDTKAYEEWCHWLVTDIPVGYRGVIPAAPSSHFKPERLSNVDPASPFASLPSPPTENKLPGNVVLDYVPIHPAFSNPRNVHRYVFSVFQQPTEKLNVDSDAFKAAAEAHRQAVAAQRASLPISEKQIEGEGERALGLRERFAVLPTMKFAKQHDLKLVGFGFLTSAWTRDTSHVFTGLDIHEPVFGKLFPVRTTDLALRLDAATDIVASLPNGAASIAGLSRQSLAKLNIGRRPSFNPARVISTSDVNMEEIRKKEAERSMAIAVQITE
eukprot:jgi/Hompol1/1108/HPOL_005513-RA